MKNCNFFSLAMVLSIIASPVRSQVAYYDAMTLRKFYKYDSISTTWGSDNDSIIVIYKKYTPGLTNTIDIANAYKANPFFKEIKYNGTIRDFKSLPAIANSVVSSISGLDVTTLADGMAKFLVKRAKLELAITFFDRFKEAIADTNCRDLRTLFPATYAVLCAIGDQIYYYDAYIQTLRESFEKDLRDLSSHLPSVIENHPDYFACRPEMEAILRSGCYVAGAIKNEEPFGVILRDYLVTYLDNVNPNIKASVQTLRLFSESLRDTAIVTRPDAYWVTAQQIQMLVNDSIAFKIYLGLIYQQTKNNPIIFGNNVTLTYVLDSIAVKYNKYSNGYKIYLTNLGTRTSTLTDLISKKKTLSNDTMILEQYYQYISAGIDLLESACDVGRLGLRDTSITKRSLFFAHAKDSLSAYITTIRSAANLVWDVKRRSYASAVVNTASIYNIAFSDTSIQTGRYLLKYGTFMATIVQAKTSDEIESAIEATALPAGSARIKRESCFDVALNAYVGGFAGTETDRLTGVSSSNTVYGMNAPVGIALSTSFCNWSVTLFGSIIDLGAVTAYRVKNDSVSNLPTLALANIVAPGIHIVLGIKGIPISIGYGWQIGPQLRTVTSTTATTNNIQGYRSAVFIAVDIPLMEIHNRSRN